MKTLVLTVWVAIFFMMSAASAHAKPMDTFVRGLREKARAEGISDDLLDQVFDGFTINHRVLAKDKQQPEDTLRFTKYRQNIVSAARVQKGREMYAKHRILLEQVAKTYGVPAPYILALWGIETNYGSFSGGENVPRALASLAYEGRREALFTREFITSLKIIQEGNISFDQMKGSWAGAMGQCQFMPSSYLHFAVDYDGDGHKNIWTSLPDVFASIANYLNQSGWQQHEGWGKEVTLPQGFDVAQENINGFFPITHWRDRGIRFADGTSLPDGTSPQAAFMLPGKPSEGAYLIYPNYHIFLKWNFSRLFGTAVGLLADEIAKGNVKGA